MPSLSAHVRGQVQGVGFRAFAAREARLLELAGYAANRADGTVEVYAEGPQGSLERFLEILRRGPRHGRVESCEASFHEGERRLVRFEIR